MTTPSILAKHYADQFTAQFVIPADTVYRHLCDRIDGAEANGAEGTAHAFLQSIFAFVVALKPIPAHAHEEVVNAHAEGFAKGRKAMAEWLKLEIEAEACKAEGPLFSVFQGMLARLGVAVAGIETGSDVLAAVRHCATTDGVAKGRAEGEETGVKKERERVLGFVDDMLADDGMCKDTRDMLSSVRAQVDDGSFTVECAEESLLDKARAEGKEEGRKEERDRVANALGLEVLAYTGKAEENETKARKARKRAVAQRELATLLSLMRSRLSGEGEDRG